MWPLWCIDMVSWFIIQWCFWVNAIYMYTHYIPRYAYSSSIFVSINKANKKTKYEAFCIIMELWLLTSSNWIKTEVIYHVGVFSIFKILFTRQDTGLEIAFHRWNISDGTMSQVIRPLTRWFFKQWWVRK